MFKQREESKCHIQSRPWQSHPVALIPPSPENGGWPAGVTGKAESLAVAPEHTHTHTYILNQVEKTCVSLKTSICARPNLTVSWSKDKPKYSTVWGKLPWGHFPPSPGPEEQMQRRAGPDWLLWSTHRHTHGLIEWQKMNLASFSCARNMCDLPVCWVCSQRLQFSSWMH